MSGTSADCIDVALCRFVPTSDIAFPKIHLVHFASHPHLDDIHSAMKSIVQLGPKELAVLDRRIGEAMAQACALSIEQCGLTPRSVSLIGSHGQTIYHHNGDQAIAATVQIGDGDFIAERLGIPVVSDFRIRDIAAGGQGAPISPVADPVLFHNQGTAIRRSILNVGGLANITVLDDHGQIILGFDTGPGNCLLDRLARRMTNGKQAYDVDGHIASEGAINYSLLEQIVHSDSFLPRPPPKSTGFERYGDTMLDDLIAWHGAANADLMATLSEFTARSVAIAIERHVQSQYRPRELVVGGGGSQNPDLMRRLARVLAPITVSTTDAHGVPSQAREAMAFAILAYRFALGLPSTWPNLTGVRHPTVLGKLSYGQSN